MNAQFIIAIGGSIVAIIAVAKMDKSSIEKVSIILIDSFKEYALARSIAC